MKQNVLVTGANGQLGRTIQELYSKNELELNFKFVSKAELDITNIGNMTTFFSENKFDYCINCAAYTNVKQAETNPEIAFKINAEGVKNLALNCSKYNITLIHISTDYVFNGAKKTPYTEKDIPNPINEYGKSKLEGEKAIQNILNEHYIIRTSWLYSKYENNFVKTILNLVKKKEILKVVNDQIGTPTNARNLAEVILKIINSKKDLFGTYHYANLGQTSWYGFANKILKIKNIDKKIIPILTDKENIANRPKFSVLDTIKIQECFSITILNWPDSLRSVLIK